MIVAVLCGATAAGKSSLALPLAKANGFEILSADSRQMYRGLEIGSGAPTAEDRAAVPHHLIGCLDPSEGFSPRQFPARVHALLAERPEANFLLVGGTGLYLKELLYPAAFDRGPTPTGVRDEVRARMEKEGSVALHAELARIDPEAAVGVHPNDAYRVAKRLENLLITGESYKRLEGPRAMDPRFAAVPILRVDLERERLYDRIDARVEEMARRGWPEETRRLMAMPGWADFPAMTSLGYRQMAQAVAGDLSMEMALTIERKPYRRRVLIAATKE